MNLCLETSKTVCGFLTDVRKIQSFPHNNCFGMVSASTQVACYPKDNNFNPHSSSRSRSGSNPHRRKPNENQRIKPSIQDFVVFEAASRKKGWRPDPALANALLDSLILENRTKKATEVVEMMISAGVVPDKTSYKKMLNHLCTMLDGTCCIADVYNDVIIMLCWSGRTYLAMELFEIMIDKGYEPNEATYPVIAEGIFEDGGKELGSEVLEFLHREKLVKERSVQGLALRYDVKRLQAKEQLL